MAWPYVDMAELVLRVRRRADLSASSTNPQFVGAAEIEEYVQKSWEKLYNLLVGKYEDYFVKTATESSIVEYTTDAVGIVPGKKDYNLPVDYFKLIKIELRSSTFTETEPGVWTRATDGDYLWTLKKLGWMQERLNCNPDDQAAPRYYILYGRMDVGTPVDLGQTNGLRLVATPDQRYGMDVFYVPRPAVIPTSDGETVDGLSFVAGWDEYVVVDATIKCRDKREEDTRTLQEERADWLKTVEEALMPRDAGQPNEIVAYPEAGAWGDNEELMDLYR